jgi:hypothetical protein
MKEFLIITGFQLLIYVAMIAWAYFDLRAEKKEGYIRSVTIRKVLKYWDLILYLPILGTVILLACFALAGFSALRDWIVKTSFWQRFQNWLDKEV